MASGPHLSTFNGLLVEKGKLLITDRQAESDCKIIHDNITSCPCPVHDEWEVLLLQYPLPITIGIKLLQRCVFLDCLPTTFSLQ